MRPRIIGRTHYQADEPHYLLLLIRRCTSATQSRYKEDVAGRLASVANLNPVAAAYAVDFARGLQLLADNMNWGESAFSVHAASDSDDSTLGPDLSPPDALVLLKVLLTYDGAAVGWIARWMLDHGELPGGSDLNALATEMHVSAFRSAYESSQTMVDRVALRQELDRLSKGFTGRTGEHKMLPHLQCMYRVGLLRRESSASSRSYSLLPRHHLNAVAALADHHVLEATARQEQLMDVAAEAMGYPLGDPPRNIVRAAIARSYHRIHETGITVSSMTAVLDASQTRLFLSGNGVARAVIREVLHDENARNPRKVRFHVDRAGRPAFLKLDTDVIEEWSK